MPADTSAEHSNAGLTPATEEARQPKRHVVELDGVRGIAILGVMLLHFVGGSSGGGGIERAAAKLATYGVWGVDLFFVLSGFLITGILYDAKGGAHYFRNFYARRTLRIFPLYYAVLLLIAVAPAHAAARFFPMLGEVQRTQGWLWTYLTNIYVARSGAFSIPYVSHFWSLAVEEHFYLVWPLLISLSSLTAAKRACLVLGVGALGLRIFLSVASASEVDSIVLTPCRLDALCAGAWFALALRAPAGRAPIERLAKAWLPRMALVVLALSGWHALVGRGDAVALPLRGSALALFFGLSIVSFSIPSSPSLVSRALRARWLRTLGKYSYGLYVFHGIVAFSAHEHRWQERCSEALGSHGAATAVVAIVASALSFGIALTSYELFERPVLQLKRWFEYRAEPRAISGEASSLAHTPTPR